jgi:cytochrome c553
MSKLSHRDLEDSECEQAYRRGYAYGVRATLSALAAKLSEDELANLEAWFTDVLAPWAEGAGTSHPPEPPRWF